MKRLAAVLALSVSVAFAGCGSPGKGGGKEQAKEEEEKDEGGEVSVALADVPAAIVKAAEAAVPGIAIEKAGKETDEGKTYFELSGKVGGSKVDVLVTPEGEVVQVERIVPLDSVPEAVKAAAVKRLPGFVADRAESSWKKDRTTFELRGKVGGKVYEIALSESGEVLEVEDS
jgi:hypothetical protein